MRITQIDGQLRKDIEDAVVAFFDRMRNAINDKDDDENNVIHYDELMATVNSCGKSIGVALGNICWDNCNLSAFDVPWEKWFYEGLIHHFATKQDYFYQDCLDSLV